MKRCEHNDYPTSCPFCRIAALESELAANTLPCGHHHSLMLKSAETGDQLYCELCDLRDQRNDLEIELEAIQRVAEQYQDEAGTLTHELAQARNETAMLRDVLMRSGFVPCDIPACNCGSFHHRYGLPERMNELRDALVDADVLDNSTGNLPLNAVKKLHMQRDEAQAWKRAIDDLLATWYTTADSYARPREAVKALIAFEVMTALDPKVSSDAAALVEQARQEEREACAKLCDSLRSVIVDDALVPAAPGHCAAAIRARKP